MLRSPAEERQLVAAIHRATAAISAACVEIALENLKHAWLKANFDPNQPRVPAGSSQGGQWTDDSDSLGASRSTDSGSWIRIAQIDGAPPGIGHNQGPPLENPPTIPTRRPATAREVNTFLKAAAQWAARAVKLGGPVAAFLASAEAVLWLNPERPYFEAYLDTPKTLRELQNAAADPKNGYNIHHVVEQTPAEKESFLRLFIDSPENLVRIPTLKHWEITAWFGKKNKDFGGLSPRQYLDGKSWEEKVRVGLDALQKHGVLKP